MRKSDENKKAADNFADQLESMLDEAEKFRGFYCEDDDREIYRRWWRETERMQKFLVLDDEDYWHVGQFPLRAR